MRYSWALVYLAFSVILFGCNLTDTKEEGSEPDNGDQLETCPVDTSKAGYELAAELDNCLIWNAQRSMAHIESEEVEVRATYLTDADFGSSNSVLNKEELWIEATYAFVTEDMSDYPDAPASINVVVMAKMKTKESIDAAFGFSNDKKQGLCADAQQDVYDEVLSSCLTEAQRTEYAANGKTLSFIPDDDVPPLTEESNPVAMGCLWLPIDPASKITHKGDDYFYEPMSLFVESNDPNLPEDMAEGLKGVRYCKLLTHQAILSWMVEKSFEDDPVLITPAEGGEIICDEPSSFESKAGSCFFYFSPAKSYYCSDYTGEIFADPNEATENCSHWASNDVLETKYSEKPCRERTDEIEAAIPDYVGFNGACVINCKEEDEFIWNIYQDGAPERCTGYDLITKEEVEELLGE